LSGRGLCDELITRPEESYRLCCAVVCDLETSRMGAPYIYDISHLRVKPLKHAVPPGNIAFLNINFCYVCITKTKSSTFCRKMIAICSGNFTCGQNY